MKKRSNKVQAIVSLCVIVCLVAVVALLSNARKPSTNVAQDNASVPAQNSDAVPAQPEAASNPTQPQQEAAPAEQSDYEPATQLEWDNTEEVVQDGDEDPQDESGAKETFVMPEGKEYEPEVALISVDPAASASEVNEALSNMEGISFEPVTDEDIDAGLVKVTLAEGVSVEDGVNSLLLSDVVRVAQPNYVYRTSDLLCGDVANMSEGATSVAAEPSNAASNANNEAAATDGSTADGNNDAAANESEQEPQGAADSTADSAEQPEASVEDPEGKTDESSQSTEDAATEPLEQGGSVTAESASEETASDTEGTNAPVVKSEAVRAEINDPKKSNQWGLEAIQAYEAWNLQKVSGSVTVAVMDMGFYTNSDDLKGNLLTGYNAYANSSNVDTGSSSDRQHGTHVAGIIGAIANNSKGIAGASYNAKILPIMVAGYEKGEWVVTSLSFSRAFNYVLKNASSKNIRVINMSVGSDELAVEGWVKDAIKSAYKQNIVTVASAGNLEDGHSVAYRHYPSDIDECVAVMSLRNNGSSITRSPDSNYNVSSYDTKDICAPGVEILSTTGGSSYGYMSGTSMATPFVSSIVALEFAANSKLTAKDASDILYGTADDLGTSGWDISYGWGKANAYKAVLAAKSGLSASQAAAVANNTARQERLRDDAAAKSVYYRTHVQTYGWQGWKSNGAMSGTSGQAKRLEGIQIKLQGAPYSGGIEYRTHVQTYGWQGWKANGVMSGTSGQAKRLEAIEIRLTGEMANHYDVWYHVHAQTYGWMGWTKNGARSGTATLGKRLEAIEIRILPKGSSAPGSTSQSYVTRSIMYRTHVQTYGWQSWRYDGTMSGTSGQAKRLEGINISLCDPLYSGGIRYRTHVQTYGWQGWKYNGAMSGTSGQAKRLEAICIELTGTMAQKYDVWYRVHAQTFGWMGWAKNGEKAGTAAWAKRLEGIQIRLLPKGSSAPGSTANAFNQR